MGAFAIARLEIPAASARITEKTSAESRGATESLERLVAHIPTEVLTLYLSALALLDTTSNGLRWFMSGIGVAFAPLAVLAAEVGRFRSVNKALAEENRAPRSFRKPVWPMVASAVSFALWVLVLPGSVAASLSIYSTRAALLVVLVGEFLVAVLDRIIGWKSTGS